MTYINHKFVLKQRPYGEPDQNTWSFDSEEISGINDGQILVENLFISLDPAMRGWMDDRRSYIPPVGIGEVMRAGTVGVVIESKNDSFKAGDHVVSWHGVQKYAVTDGSQDFNLGKQLIAPIEKFLGVLGMPGYTAYFGLMEVGLPKEGETIVVSAAAGAVGSVVGQIAKAKGLRVIGIAGGKEKCDHVVSHYGFDACVDYKSIDFAKQLIDNTKSGVDIYFDNVGGEMLDLILTRINKHARIVICGAISQYNNTSATYGPTNYLSLLVNSARMEGFVILDYKDRYMEAAMQLGQWLAAGKIKSDEFIVDGLEFFPDAFKRLFTGEKRGKLLLKV